MLRTAITLLALIGLAVAVQAPVPVSQEHHHHFKFENEYVRVYDTSLDPGDETLFHIHSNDYAYVNLFDVNLKAQVLGGPIVDLPVKAGQCIFSKAPLTHRVMNPTRDLFRNITVEILKNPHSAAQEPAMTGVPGYSIVLDNERIRVARLVLEPGQSTGIHTHNLMSLGVAVTGAKVAYQEPGQAEQVAELKAGDFNWHPTKRTHTVKNVGQTRFEAIEIELK
jgi:quercetin dioxygenase-like cupin family protein